MCFTPALKQSQECKLHLTHFCPLKAWHRHSPFPFKCLDPAAFYIYVLDFIHAIGTQ